MTCYMKLLEDASNALDDLGEARSQKASQRKIDRLETIYSNKAWKIIKYMSNLSPKECEPIEGALKSLGF